MRLLTSLAMVLLLGPAGFGAELRPTLVDGFDGWTPSGLPECFVIEGGVLSIENDPDLTGAILWTDREYEDFAIELEFRFVSGQCDSGVFLRGEREQIQIGDSGSMKRDMTASPYIAGKGYPVEATGVASLLDLEGWNSMRVEAVGPRYRVWLNGEAVLDYTSESSVARGPVGLQLHPKREMAMQYRNVRLGELTD